MFLSSPFPKRKMDPSNPMIKDDNQHSQPLIILMLYNNIVEFADEEFDWIFNTHFKACL